MVRKSNLEVMADTMSRELERLERDARDARERRDVHTLRVYLAVLDSIRARAEQTLQEMNP